MPREYYDQHASEFFRNTIDIDMSEIYRCFCQYLNRGDRILDAGCGSGRDIIAFKKMGYNVDAFDASPEMAKIAAHSSCVNVSVSSFQNYETSHLYDGIWCCASLLHVPLNELNTVTKNLSRALKQNGVWYVSFKYGDKEREENGRHFTDMNEVGLTDLVQQANGLDIVRIWITDDARPGRMEKWLNAILKKT